MSVRIVLEATGFGLRAAALDGDHRLIEVRDVDQDEPRVSEAMFAARVTAVDPRLNAAFLDVGMALPGLIVAKDARAAAGVAERRPIRDLVREGQRLIVQGLREPAGDKGARFTSDVKLLGFALVHAPLTAGIEAAGGGRRAEDPSRERGRALFPEGRFALRRHAADLSDEALQAEAGQLADRWARLQAAARTAKPGRLPEPEGMLERLVRGLLDLAPRTIAAADPALLRELERLVADTPTLPPLEIERLAPGEPAFDQTGVSEALETALGREVPLPGGGRLLIEPTAACVAIDVDGGGGGKSPLETDLGAVGEIARQVRLRNLGGTILVDFVDLPHKHERQRLEDALKRAFRHDPAPIDVHPMSSLGIVQISRARRGQPLADRFRAPCRCCDGSGQVSSPRAAAERLLAELGLRTRPVATVSLGAELARFLKAEGAPGWRRLVARIGHEPTLRADATMGAVAFLIEEAGHGR